MAWDGDPSGVTVRLPAAQSSRRLAATVYLEGGEVLNREWDLAKQTAVAGATHGGRSYVEKTLPLDARLPWGCHRLVLEQGDQVRETLVIASPTRGYVPGGRSWGVFLPLYALHSETSWGAGDFSDLGRLLEWVRGLGGGVVATLPLLAAFLDEPFEPSPYSPASRLFWNEFYLDVAAIPELGELRGRPGDRSTRPRFAGRSRGTPPRAARRLPPADGAQAAGARGALPAPSSPSRTAGARRSSGSSRRTPRVEDYARFRAAGERHRAPWPTWPAAQRATARSSTGDYDEAPRRYHLYVQWLADEQLEGVSVEGAGRPGRACTSTCRSGVNGQRLRRLAYARVVRRGGIGGMPARPRLPQGAGLGLPAAPPRAASARTATATSAPTWITR